MKEKHLHLSLFLLSTSIVIIIFVISVCIYHFKINSDPDFRNLTSLLRKNDTIVIDKADCENILYAEYTYSPWPGDGHAFFILKLSKYPLDSINMSNWSTMPMPIYIEQSLRPNFYGEEVSPIYKKYTPYFDKIFSSNFNGYYFLLDIKDDIYLNLFLEDEWQNYLQKYSDDTNVVPFSFFDHMMLCVVDTDEELLYIFQRNL